MKNVLLLFGTCFLLSCQTTHPVRQSADLRQNIETAQAVGEKYVISTQGHYSSLAAKEMYDQGGNIIDAFVAASFTVSVERPQSTGIGGGGFLLYHDAKTKKTYAVDFRERAPLKATEKMYQDAKGEAVREKSVNGINAAGTPGLVAGLLEVHQKFGKLPLATVLAPAIRLAEDGFPIYAEFQRALEYRKAVLAKDPEAKKIFLMANGDAPAVGAILKQKELAQTLRDIQKEGAKSFYKGKFAQALDRYSKAQKGYLSSKDLQDYKVIWREPLFAKFKEFEVYSMPPPSSGGVHVIQFLKFLENDDLKSKGALTAPSIHLAASALQSSFADRATYLGDPDFVIVPSADLISDKYVQRRRVEVPLERARKANEVKAGDVGLKPESTETTHMSLMDAEGNAVSSTQTVNGWMGAAVVVPGPGVLLNNEMDDFSAQTGASNIFGAIGGKPNAIAPRKTPLSSMSPTILFEKGAPRMVVGAPGGTRIISCVAQTILNYTEFGMSLYDSVAAVRYHHQWQPDVLMMEPPGPASNELEQLKKMGYEVKLAPVSCNVMATAKEGAKLRGVADPRDIGTSLAH